MSTLLATRPQGMFLPETTRCFMANGKYGAPQKQYTRNYTLPSGDTVTSLRFEGVPVFRSGTFRDSWGDQTTWTNIHTAEMISHFNYLKDQSIFPDVPVRKGHGSFLSDPMDSLIGYIDNMTAQTMTSPVDGRKYSYLLADYDILDEEAQEKIASGLWRNRSAEIGTFVTNDEQMYSPTFMGFAYVDIPAVEGLNGAFSKTNPDFAIERGPKEQKYMATKSTDSSDDSTKSKPQAAPPPPPAPAAKKDSDPKTGKASNPTDDNPAPDPGGKDTDLDNEPSGEVEPVQAPVGAPGSKVLTEPVFAPEPVDEDDEELEVTDPPAGPVGVQDPDAPKEKEKEEEAPEPLEITELPQGPIFAKWVGNHFEIGGRVTDPTAVAALINKYQAANVALFDKEKKDRVTALAKDHKIMATSLEGTLAYAAGLSRTQFDSWIALEEARPELPLFGKYASGVESKATTDKSYELGVCRDIVASLRRQNKPKHVVEASNSWAKGKALATELGVPWE